MKTVITFSEQVSNFVSLMFDYGTKIEYLQVALSLPKWFSVVYYKKKSDSQ